MTKLTVETDRSEVAAAGSTVTASIRIQPGMAEDDVTRHISLCLDTSGSMSGEKMEQVREGVRWVFGYLADDDYFSIVSFDDEVEVLMSATRWGDVDLDEAEDLVDDLKAGGGTDILGGLETAHETLASLPAGPDVGRRILLLSDGRDETPASAFTDFARRVRREDSIAVPAAGIGEDYDEETIRRVGTGSDGEWVHLSHATDIEDFFGRKVESLRTVVAPNPNLEIGLPAGAAIGDAFLRHPQVRDANYELADGLVRIYLPDLLEFELQELVLTIDTPPCEIGRRFTLADVRLTTREGTTNSAVQVECVQDRSVETTVVDSAQVATKHVETRIRNAAAEGDLERAATLFRGATGADLEGFDSVETRVRGAEEPGDRVSLEGLHDDGTRIRDQGSGQATLDDQGTQIRGQRSDDDQSVPGQTAGEEATQIRGRTPGEGSPAEEAGEEDTQIRGRTPGEGSPAEEAGEEDTQIRGRTPDEARQQGSGLGDEGTRIRRTDVMDVSEFVDDETVSRWGTMIKEAESGDRETKYETTIINESEER
ncbi:MAG: VWA domain-containing protein [Haloarculaceae archaeon]